MIVSTETKIERIDEDKKKYYNNSDRSGDTISNSSFQQSRNSIA